MVKVTGPLVVSVVDGALMLTVGGVWSMVNACPVKGRFKTERERLMPFTRFRPSVPSPIPVLAATTQLLDGEPPTGVTEVMAGVPPRPPVTKAKLEMVRPDIWLVKLTVHETA